jgi:SAM-dependent methyltransferase
MAEDHYVIAGGRSGRDRLRVLTRVFAETTEGLLDRAGVGPGMACLDVGCGGGDMTTALARRVGPPGTAVGIDCDATALDIARQEAAERDLTNVEYRALDVFELADRERFDVVYARFLLSHLSDPGAALERLVRSLARGGTLVVEDVDFSGHFAFPACPAFADYVRLYSEAARARGVDPDIGPRLPSLLREAGVREIDLRVVQPAGISGEPKLLSAITMELIGPAVVTAGLASADEIARIVEALEAAARDEHTVLSVPRIVQVWGRR